MKKFSWLAVVFGVVCMYSACTKDKTLPPPDTTCSGVDSTTNTYNLRIKGILDANCSAAGCHDAIFFSAGVVTANYAGAKTAFETKNALCAIKQEGSCLPMPQGSGKLADSLITYIQCWSENGYPE